MAFTNHGFDHNAKDYGTNTKNKTYENDQFQENRPYGQKEFDRICKQRQFTNDKGIMNKIKDKMTSSEKSTHWIKSIFPILIWLPNYNWKIDFCKDFIAGSTIAVLHIPQGMAYSILAGVPPITGIYMAFFPVLIYILTGTSRHISMGSFSIICMMTAQSVIYYSDPNVMQLGDTPVDSIFLNGVTGTGLTPNQVAAAVSFVVGAWHVLFSFMRFGHLSVLMSDPMISGFTTGAAILVIHSQIKHVFGLTLPRHAGPFKVVYTLIDIYNLRSQTNIYALEIAILSTLTLLIYGQFIKDSLTKKIRIPLPIELIVVVIGTYTSTHFKLHDQYNISVVGTIPKGFPAFEPPPMWLLPHLVVNALVIAIVLFSINTSMASLLATQGKYSFDPNQELFATGASNIFGSFFSCVPFGASISRSVIQIQSGGQTQLASAVSCGWLILVLLYIGPFFESLPHCVLTGIIIVAMKSMIMQFKDFITYYHASKYEALVWFVTCTAVILFDIELGLIAGIVISLLYLGYAGQKVIVSKLGRLFATDMYVECNNYGSAIEISNFKILRIVGALNFLNKNRFVTKINKYIKKKDQNDIKYLILDLMAVSSIDSTIVKTFIQLHNELIVKNIELKLVNVSGTVLKSFESGDFFKHYPEIYLYPTIHDAVLAAYNDKKNQTNNNIISQTIMDSENIEKIHKNGAQVENLSSENKNGIQLEKNKTQIENENEKQLEKNEIQIENKNGIQLEKNKTQIEIENGKQLENNGINIIDKNGIIDNINNIETCQSKIIIASDNTKNNTNTTTTNNNIDNNNNNESIESKVIIYSENQNKYNDSNITIELNNDESNSNISNHYLENLNDIKSHESSIDLDNHNNIIISIDLQTQSTPYVQQNIHAQQRSNDSGIQEENKNNPIYTIIGSQKINWD